MECDGIVRILSISHNFFSYLYSVHSLTDDLLEELISDVGKEMLDACDEYVRQLVDSELTDPPQ